jgi:AcrR family transcriptional regulator
MAEPGRRDRERLAREEAIVDAAEEIFIGVGFDEASMDEMAAAAEFTKRTLYQYFPSKEDLYLAVVAKGFRRLVDLLAASGAGAADGLSRLREYGRALYGFYRERPEGFRLIAQWSYVVRVEPGKADSAARMGEVNRELFGLIAAALREGVADGSVEPSIEVEPTMCRLVFLLTGFLSQMAATGESFSRQFGLDPEEFCLSTFDMVLESLSPTRARPAARKGAKRSVAP